MKAEVATFRTKTPDFTLVIRLNWLEKIEIRRCAGPPSSQYYLLLITVVRVYCCTQRCLKKLKMNKQDFFCQICVIGGILIEWSLAPWTTPLALPMILRLDRALKFYHKKIQSKIKITFFPKRGGLESSHRQFFQTSKNCMTLL